MSGLFSPRVRWTALSFVAPWAVGTAVMSAAYLQFYGPLEWDPFGRGIAAMASIWASVACWTYPGWGWGR